MRCTLRTSCPSYFPTLRASRGYSKDGPVCKATSLDEGDTGSWSLPPAPSYGDWREFRAQLVARSRKTHQTTWDEIDDSIYGKSPAGDNSGDWAHILSTPEVGCVLLANPLCFQQDQTYFDKAVVLIIDISDEGSMGIILNKPSELRLRDMQDVVIGNRFQVFAHNKVYLGGDVDGDGLYLLHNHAVQGAQEIRPNLYLGGAEKLAEGVSNNSILPESVSWFCRYAGWHKHQLADECARNIWYPVSCSTSLLLPRIPMSHKQGSDMWHDIMEHIGDDFRRVSRTIRTHESKPRLQ